MQKEDFDRIIMAGVYCPSCLEYNEIVVEGEGYVCLECQKMWKNYKHIATDLMRGNASYVS